MDTGSTISRETEDRIQRAKIYRVQGGKSRQLIVVSEKGVITDVDEDDYIYISIADELAEAWRGKKNREDAKLLVLEVSSEFYQALTIPSRAQKLGLPKVQPSQDKKWVGQSFAIKGPEWAAFLKKEQDSGHSKVWDMDKYWAQFEVEKEPEDHDVIWTYEEDSPDEGMELGYGKYKESLYPDWKWMTLSQAKKEGYLQD